ncbi:MAG: Multicopper oxidase type 3 [Hyphomicrobiales bacterium]|nr:Multicopper oxidase type 3 [Hyphomicrobiales bacterium]
MTITRRALMASTAATLCAPRFALAQEVKSLTARKGAMRLLPESAPESEIISFGPPPFGPILRMKLGDSLKLRLENQLDSLLTLHWRGVRSPNAFDGAAPLTQKPVGKGESFEIAFTPPDAGVFIFHPSIRAEANAQMARGLAGLLIVEEREPPVVDHDLPCLLADWREDESEPLVFVNGSPDAQAIEARPRARIRIRLGSASTRRVMAVALEGAKAQVAAIDSQPCDLFEPVRQTLPLAPGGRYDLFFDLPDEAGAKAALVLQGMSGAPGLSRPLITFKTMGEPRAALPPIAALPANPKLPARIQLEKAKRLDLVIAAAPGKSWTVNGQPADEIGAKPVLSVKRGTVVTLGFVNKSPAPQLIHVHGHTLRHIHLLDDGWDPYWRDSVIVPEGKTIRTAFVADNPGKWLVEGGFGTGDGPVVWFEVTG